MKTCSKCKETKELTEYYKHKIFKDGLSSICKICQLNKIKKYQFDNHEKTLERQKRYYTENKEYFKAKNKKYYILNKEVHNKYCSDKKKERRKTDHIFKFKCIMYCRINGSIKNKGYTKQSRTYDIIGCSFEEFKIHIEMQFTKGMNWDNIGKWHIDHIIPMATAKTEEEVIRLNHYTNLRPLWAEENLSKSDKIITQQLVLL